MLTLLVGTGLYLTILLKGLQFRVLPLAFRLIWHKDHGHDGDISHFAALMTALAAYGRHRQYRRRGNGNLPRRAGSRILGCG